MKLNNILKCKKADYQDRSDIQTNRHCSASNAILFTQC